MHLYFISQKKIKFRFCQLPGLEDGHFIRSSQRLMEHHRFSSKILSMNFCSLNYNSIVVLFQHKKAHLFPNMFAKLDTQQKKQKKNKKTGLQKVGTPNNTVFYLQHTHLKHMDFFFFCMFVCLCFSVLINLSTAGLEMNQIFFVGFVTKNANRCTRDQLASFSYCFCCG